MPAEIRQECEPFCWQEIQGFSSLSFTSGYQHVLFRM
jgi:hypothetical protein